MIRTAWGNGAHSALAARQDLSTGKAGADSNRPIEGDGPQKDDRRRFRALTFETIEKTLHIAGDKPYGLSHRVWNRDTRMAHPWPMRANR